MKRTYIYITLILFLSSCLQDTIRPKELLNYSDKVVVNGLLDNSNNVSIQITNSKSSFDEDLPRLIRDAEVQLVQNEIEHTLTFDALSDNYTKNLVLNSEDNVTLIVRHPDYPLARSIVKIPQDLSAQANLTVNGGVDTSGLISDLLEITLNDQKGVENFYRINFYYINQTINQAVPFVFPRSDPSLAEFNSFKLNDGSILFSDDLFDGLSKTFSAVPVQGIAGGGTGDKYLIELSTINKDLFEYYRSLQRAEEAKEVTFQAGYNNAVVIHSNVTNGLGILGAINAQQYYLR